MTDLDRARLIPILAVVGPTAAGKTGLAIELAKKYNGEIISADSMQIYKGVSIATAKPTREEMQGITHHLMSFLDPTETFSVAQYVALAHQTILDIHSRGKLPILAGGTGLYIHSVLNHISFEQENTNPAVRKNLEKRLKAEGVEVLLKELAVYDAQSAERLGREVNEKRIIRAIEIYEVSGITMTQHMINSKQEPSPYHSVRIGLNCHDRANLYNRINTRVDIMCKQGLLKEAEQYRLTNLGQTAAQAIGYKELEPYFLKEKTLEECLDHLKMETRHYAKRQLTWFRKDEKINWIYIDSTDNQKVTDLAAAIVDQSGIFGK